MDIGTRIKILRTERGLTQPELAQAVEQTTASINSYEKGSRKPHADTLMKLSRFFGVSTDYLLCIEDRPNSAVGAIPGLTEFKTRAVPVMPESTVKVNKLSSIADETEDNEEPQDETITAPVDLDADLCLRCLDDAMTGFGIRKNDTVFISLERPANGDIAAIYHDGKAFLRRVNTAVPGFTLYEAADRNYESIVIADGDKTPAVQVIGKAVAIQRYLP